MRIRGLIVLAVAVATARTAQAQFGGQGSRIPIANRSYISINPLGIPFDIVSAEAETGVAQGVTIGGVASYTDLDSDRYTSFDFKVRYYPGEVVLRGFSLGLSVGYLNYSTTDPGSSGFPSGRDRVSLNVPTLGLIVDYNWLLGSQHRFLVGTGLGAKRVLASSDDRSKVGLDRAYPTARFTIGLAF